MKTILFDIDGTLLRTGGAGMLAINQTFVELFGIQNEINVPVRGRTDHGILGDLLRGNDLDFDEHYRNFADHYHQRLPEFLYETKGELLPGVREILNVLRSKAHLGILTGNAENAAWTKLKHFQLDEYFTFGGFGDHHSDRNDVAAEAFRNAGKSLGNEFEISKCWVIGDTPADVVCAKSIHAKSIAVLTGGFEECDFEDTHPDLVVNDLKHLLRNELHHLV